MYKEIYGTIEGELDSEFHFENLNLYDEEFDVETEALLDGFNLDDLINAFKKNIKNGIVELIAVSDDLEELYIISKNGVQRFLKACYFVPDISVVCDAKKDLITEFYKYYRELSYIESEQYRMMDLAKNKLKGDKDV